jgi:REP element-mobilizing transposase RayT
MGAAKPRPNEPPMPDPLAYFLTWTTYGTWLPGDERGWVKRGEGFQLPDPIRRSDAEARMTEDACSLDNEQRKLVETTIADHCRIRGWYLHTVNCRTNHVHVVVTASRDPDEVREQFKAWCTRKLKELQQSRTRSATLARRASEGRLPARRASEGRLPARRASEAVSDIRRNWWTERGSKRFIGDEESLEAVIRYVRDLQ